MRKQGILTKLLSAALVIALAGGAVGLSAVDDVNTLSVSAVSGDISVSGIFSFTDNADGTLSLFFCDYKNSDNSELVIPDTSGGKSVSVIRADSFMSSDNKSNKEYNIKIGRNIKTIEEFAFDGIAVNNISVDKDNKFFTVVDNVLYTKDMSTLVYCPSKASGKITIPSGVRTIRDDAFTSSAIEEIYIGHDISQIPSDGFIRCSGILRFSLNSKNNNYSIVSGALLNKDKTEVLAYPKGKTADFSIPKTVTRIGDYVFSGSKIQTVNLSNVKQLGSFAFEGCRNIKKIVIPKQLSDIGTGAFKGCTSIATVKADSGVTKLPDELFADCTSLKTISLPDTITDFGLDVFANTAWYNAKANGFVYLGKYLYGYKTAYKSTDSTGDPSAPVNLSIKSGTLAAAKGSLRGANVVKLIIPSSLRYLDTYALYPAYNIKQFSVNKDNKYFTVKDKSLLSYDMKKLICAVSEYNNDSYTVPSTVNEIGDLAFKFNKDINNIYVSENVVKFGASPFNNGNSKRAVVCMEGSAAAAAAKDDDVNRIYLEAGIMLNKSKLTLGAGESVTLSATVTPDIAKRQVSWKSSDTSVAKVVGGKVTALKKGTATITASEKSGSKAVCTVNVSPAPTSVRMTKTNLTVGVGEVTVISSSLNSGAASMTRKYTSSDPSVISIDEKSWECRFTARKAGTATITVQTFNGKKASCKVTVKKAPESVKMSKTQISIGVGETITIGSTLSSGSASLKRAYTSSNSDVAGINPTSWNCSFTGISPGTAVLTVKTYNNKTATCKVTVKAPPKYISMAKNVVNIGKGESMTLGSVTEGNAACATRKYRTSNSSIVKMTRTNWVAGFKGENVGTAYVTAMTYNGMEGACRVNVKNAPTSVKISKSTLNLRVGQKAVLESSVPEGTAATNRKYRSSNSSIIKMTRTDWQGEFKALQPGVCWVTVRTYNGKESSCKITVTL